MYIYSYILFYIRQIFCQRTKQKIKVTQQFYSIRIPLSLAVFWRLPPTQDWNFIRKKCNFILSRRLDQMRTRDAERGGLVR